MSHTPAQSWSERMGDAISAQGSILCVGLDPIWEMLPAEYKVARVADGIFAHNRRIIDGAAPYAAAFKPQYKCYSAEGEEGIRALRLTSDYIKREYPHIPIILDAKYADVGHVLERCAHEAYNLYGVDAVTAMPAPGRQALAPLFDKPGRGCFMVARLSNPGAEELQDLPLKSSEPLYIGIARRIAEGWNQSGNVGLVAPATNPSVLSEIRAAAPNLPILCPGVGAQGGDVTAAVHAGLDSEGAGLLINVSRAIIEATDPGEAARHWRDLMEEARRVRTEDEERGSRDEVRITRNSELTQSSVLSPQSSSVIVELYRIGAIRFEPVKLKSGLISPCYTNLRVLSSYPRLLREVATLMSETMETEGLKPDIVIGIAVAGIPLAVAISQHTGVPAGYVRTQAKEYGMGHMVEGAWQAGATAVLVDDVVSDGASKLEVMPPLSAVGLEVRDIVVLLDRGQGGPEIMAGHGLRCHATFTMESVLDVLLAAGRITTEQVEESRRFMAEARAAGPTR